MFVCFLICVYSESIHNYTQIADRGTQVFEEFIAITAIVILIVTV